MISKVNLEIKQEQFNKAMELYNTKNVYKIIGFVVSLINISFQIVLLFLAFKNNIGIFMQFITLITAYILTDFINGFVHLLLDNNDNYTSFAGPFIASFHLHHKKPLYKKRNIFLVYFHESGSKIWLAFYFLMIAIINTFFDVNASFFYGLVYFGIFSCIAEISHYFCHIRNSTLPIFLATIKLFLSKKHHVKHHINDNIGYAFLNGISDPILNLIAKMFFTGYKTNTDLHYLKYKGPQTTNR